ncbi:hypothetical protein Ocin01_13660, partial [Orchesella cincta]
MSSFIASSRPLICFSCANSRSSTAIRGCSFGKSDLKQYTKSRNAFNPSSDKFSLALPDCVSLQSVSNIRSKKLEWTKQQKIFNSIYHS